jgi:imidazolonepropionase-like amidohydrolase
VIIRGGKILRIEGTKPGVLTANIAVINGTGKHLIPGLFDMHAHFFYEQGNYVNTNEGELKTMFANGSLR